MMFFYESVPNSGGLFGVFKSTQHPPNAVHPSIGLIFTPLLIPTNKILIIDNGYLAPSQRYFLIAHRFTALMRRNNWPTVGHLDSGRTA